jgi:hypothetical protein
MAAIKTLIGITLGIALAVGQVSYAGAAPQYDPLIGTIDEVTEGTDANGDPVIIVKYTDEDGLHHTISMSPEQADTLGLITWDPITEEVISIDVVAGDPINLTGAQLEELNPCGDAEHPVVGALCGVFFAYLGASAETIAGWHADGFGFGVITQALFMARQLEGDMTMAGLILEAKKSGDYSGFGDEYAEITNWGQFKKAVMAGEDKSMTNQGAIMSGRVLPPTLSTPAATTTTLTTTVQGKGHGKGDQHGKGGEHGKGKGKGK